MKSIGAIQSTSWSFNLILNLKVAKKLPNSALSAG